MIREWAQMYQSDLLKMWETQEFKTFPGLEWGVSMNSYPRVETVKPLKDKCLLVAFRNGVKKVYDCKPLLEDEIFSPLTDDTLFRCVKTDQGGYGISWNDEIDLSESELWLCGVPLA